MSQLPRRRWRHAASENSDNSNQMMRLMSVVEQREGIRRYLILDVQKLTLRPRALTLTALANLIIKLCLEAEIILTCLENFRSRRRKRVLYHKVAK